MWQYDFHLFYEGAKAILSGGSPYSQWDFNGPYPLAIFFIPFALLPEQIAYWLFTFLQVGLLAKIMKKRLLWALLFFPVLFTLFVGQVDLLLAQMALIGAPWTLGIIALVKPQVAFVIAPWALRKLPLREWWKPALPALALLGLSLFLRPTWITEWRAGSPGMGFYTLHASNIYWLIPVKAELARAWASVLCALLVLPAGFLLSQQSASWSLLQLFAPLTNIYSPAVLFQWVGPWEVLLSWLAMVIAGGIHQGGPYFVIGLLLLAKSYQQYRSSKANPVPVNIVGSGAGRN